MTRSRGDHADDRDETAAERADRNWTDLLQEIRVMQTGVQLIAGFLLILPFQPAFADLDAVQRAGYLVVLGLACATTAALLFPIAVHRRLFGRHVKDRLVAVAHRLVVVALAAVCLIIVGIVTLIFDVVLGRVAGVATLSVALLATFGLMVVVPVSLTRAPGSPAGPPARP